MSMNRLAYNDLISMEGELAHERALTQDKLKKIVERSKKIEEAISQLNSRNGHSLKSLGQLDLQVDDLIESSKSKNKDGGQVMAFFLGFITALFLLSIIGL
jgi:hypothetical protein